MNAQPFSSPANDLDAQAAEDAQRYRSVLHELMDIGMDLARQVQAEVKEAACAGQPATQAAGPARAAKLDTLERATRMFDCIARAVRRTVMLAQRLGEPAAIDTGPSRASKKRQIIRVIEDKIFAERLSDDAKQTLEAELLERMDGPDIADDIDHQPIGKIVQEICEDLGIDQKRLLTPRKRRTPEDIAALCAHASGARAAANADGAPAPDMDAMTRPLDPAEAERFYRLLKTPQT